MTMRVSYCTLGVIENPVAVVDVYAEKHGVLEAAQGFVDYLFTKEAQEVFARYGLRSIDPAVAKATAAQYPEVPDLFSIEYFGGWSKATPDYFSETGIFTEALLNSQVPQPTE